MARTGGGAESPAGTYAATGAHRRFHMGVAAMVGSGQETAAAQFLPPFVVPATAIGTDGIGRNGIVIGIGIGSGSAIGIAIGTAMMIVGHAVPFGPSMTSGLGLMM